jgi:serine/threonine-protein kinase RsbW
MPHSHNTLALPADLGATPLALQWIEDLAERLGWPARITFRLSLSLDEALTNVVSYAFDPPGPETPAITVSCQADDTRIKIELRDNGRPYDPTAGAPPPLAVDLDEAHVGGHGVRLMRYYLDTLDYQRQDGWNCLTLIMKIA